ncbi:N-acetylmuramoyl-L-alanine amidase [Listeria monocytogenes]|uniref:N-acetylmuramoyl-L-alanine amidase n=1 Tax=Listeria monocytogenes TaxID=1639 RepID=UPI0011EABB9A|nr:N-acetylmuramoyl-L-alanine amidase [Listeria monocytogenes]TYV04788.1 N-acetylmuramoyl-L-alanine amidase [Listeria monocytogenes]
MATVNGVPFRQNLVSSSKYGIKAPNAMKPKKVTIHNTYNDASSQKETDYCKNNNNEVSFHVAVDDKEAIQVIPFNRNAWHAGDGGNGYGNRNTIGVETCYSKSGGAKYKAAEKNTIKYVAGLCVQQDIIASKDTIKKHQDWSGKYCPHRILDEKRWQVVQQAIIDEYNRITSKSTVNKTGKQWVYAHNALSARVSADWNSKVAFAAYKFQALQVNWDVEKDGFYEVILNGKKGYMKAAYFTTTKPFTTMKTKDVTHFRVSPNWESKTAYTLKKGEEISVSKGKEANGFIDCYYRGKKGYIKKSYLK